MGIEKVLAAWIWATISTGAKMMSEYVERLILG
jgi:hypothetical protein